MRRYKVSLPLKRKIESETEGKRGMEREREKGRFLILQKYLPFIQGYKRPVQNTKATINK